MKRFWHYALALIFAVVLTAPLASCLRQDLIMYEDGEWDNNDVTEDVMTINGEIDLDDADR